MELRTRENYTYYLERVILPEFGPMKMVEILPSHIREWVSKFQNGLLEPPRPRKKGQRRRISNDPSVIQYCMVILGVIFTTALNDQVTFLHPCKGVNTPPVPKARKIITPEQFDALYQALPDGDMRLLVETDIETGARWGELVELKVRDLDRVTRVLTVSRVAVELSKPFQVDGQRFVVKHYPKDGEERQFRVSKQMVAKIVAHIERDDLQPDDLLFAVRDVASVGRPKLRAVPDPDTDAEATSPAPGSAPKYGNRPGKPQASETAYGSTTSGTPTPPGCWPEAPTSRPSRNASGTAAS